MVDIPYRRTKSAAQRIGDVPCPSCNPKELPSDEVPNVPCAWCWDDALKVHRRFVRLTVWMKWRAEHPGSVDEDEIPTSPESKSALTPIPPTDPDPNAKP